MRLPPNLKPGDLIGITCPSGYFPYSKTMLARQTLEHWGFRVLIGKTVGSAHFYFSDRDEARLDDLQYQLDHPEVKAIIMGRGGYGLSRIIDDINFHKFVNKPKWINGFSDITVLHSHINNHLKIATLHGPMCSAFKDPETNLPHLISLKKALTGEAIHYPLSPDIYNRSGKAEGILIGGNLAILAHLTGSISQLNPKGKILFIEDIGEYLYNLDRLLLNLKRAGFLKELAGLICGGFTELKDTERPFGQNIYEIILDKVKEYNYPVCFNFPAGHIEENFTLCFGKKHRLTVDTHSAQLVACAT